MRDEWKELLTQATGLGVVKVRMAGFTDRHFLVTTTGIRLFEVDGRDDKILFVDPQNVDVLSIVDRL